MEPDELFPPKPGGMVDTARRQQAPQAAPAAEGTTEPGAGYPAVRVDVMPPDVASARTIVVATGSTTFRAIEPVTSLDPLRRRAVILALDQPVVIVTSRALADDPQNAAAAAGLPASGFVLPVGIPLVLWSRSQMWAAATSATPSRVSVILENMPPGT